MFLAENNLPFRGSHSTIDYDDCGLFISTAKLVGHYSETMKNHLDTIQEYKDGGKKMSVHYLSSRSQNEFLEICAKKVQQKVIEEIKICQYYAIIVDGTPDMSHKKQLVFVIRYVFENAGTWNTRMISNNGWLWKKKTGADIANKIEEILVECNVDWALCRGQGYDNAANMSGKYNSVKSKITEKYLQASSSFVLTM